MESNISKRNIRLIGLFFILAAVSSIAGLKLYDPILSSNDFINVYPAYYNQIIIAAINELILMAAAVGTAITLYPFLRRVNESLGIGYVSFRILEVLFIMAGTLSMLTILSISELLFTGAITDRSTATSLGWSFIAVHKWSFMLGPNFMLAINTFMYSYGFYKAGMVPSSLARLGMSASVLIMIAAMLELFGVIKQISFWGILLALPIAFYEMSLATWLLRKGAFLYKERV